MKHPASSDENNDRCLMVIKRGRATGLTIGRANEICSYVREGYSKYGVYGTSKEWTIIPCDSKHGPFSLAGDSGSVIVDGQGRIGGVLTGGTGFADPSDITYATPISFILDRMQFHGLSKPNVDF
ncbi:uncharacterized protein PHACADRAFT_202705 [Phanerochaete carnosa HHB-10118-sp]|uniref:Peptidase S1 domain-containing protein n=1 Tax=Phanerochaete carnosa (strain HHB-10118-sp) TaxID=650164 RepID=K5WEB7_PHACS|nr:uncharacterized protein PHACADRAFT_202705 [Phanerochaete carnosa HHB-10118-sp]EKM48527.1 hypothetical protein PHACADRAFT_202705 [Phanerochaete carnosa HHB-10118-sp]